MIIDLIGFAGMFFILLSFIMNQVHKWEQDFLIYDLFNSMGALLLITYSILIKSYPFLILNFIWFIVSTKDVLLDLKKSKKRKKR